MLQNRKLRRDFTRRVLVSLHDLKNPGLSRRSVTGGCNVAIERSGIKKARPTLGVKPGPQNCQLERESQSNFWNQLSGPFTGVVNYAALLSRARQIHHKLL